MKAMTQTGVALMLLTCITWLPTGCSRSPNEIDTDWTPPAVISSSGGGLGGSIRLHKYHDTLLGEQPLKEGTKWLLWNVGDGSWSEVDFTGVPRRDWGATGIDPDSGRVLFAECYVENEQLVLNTFMASIDSNLKLRETTETFWIAEKKTLLGDTGPNVRLSMLDPRTGKPMPAGAGLGTVMLRGADIQIPYYFRAFTHTPPNRWVGGPFSAGVLHSTNSGKTWQLERVSDQVAPAPTVCQTASYIQFFAGPYPLLFSRKPAQGETWEKIQSITKTSHGVDGFYSAAATDDTAHICWMDLRHDKWRFNLTGPPVVNSDIYYRRRKDTDRDWNKEVWLSKGLLYCYAPTIAAKGDKVVVAWAGIARAGKWHGEYGPNDIYYATSKDGGKTWTTPSRVTDGAKDGITAGMPEVGLLDGVIHLLYIQGASQSGQVSSGMTKLGEGAWPIYHTHRPFPE